MVWMGVEEVHEVSVLDAACSYFESAWARIVYPGSVGCLGSQLAGSQLDSLMSSSRSPLSGLDTSNIQGTYMRTHPRLADLDDTRTLHGLT